MIFTETRTRDKFFGVVPFFPLISLQKKSIFDDCLSSSVSELQKLPSPGLKPRSGKIGEDSPLPRPYPLVIHSNFFYLFGHKRNV
jgi:hypothetical protein